MLSVASSLGRECLALTKFVKDSPMAAFIKAQLRARNIRYGGAEVEQGGPWGWRRQFNAAGSGFGLRDPGSGTTGRGKSAAVKNISKEEIDAVGFQAADYDGMAKQYNPEKLQYGYNRLSDSEEIYFIPNPVLGLWIDRKKF